MNYKKILLELKNKLQDSFDYSKATAEKRDSRLIEGFINKGEEECSFNEFYSNGNENIVKYAGIIDGLMQKKYTFFENVSSDYSQKIKTIKSASDELVRKNGDYKETYKRFFLGAEFCLHDYIEEDMKYNKLDNKALFYSLLHSATNIVESNVVDFKNTSELQNILAKGEKHFRQVSLINKMLDSSKYTKRNAFYAVKNFDWLHEKGTFETMGELEIKNHYTKYITKEKQAKDNLIYGRFSTETSIENSNLSIGL